MAPVRFSALYRHEWQYRECLSFLTEMETEGRVITGSLDSADVDRLRSLGLLVQLASWDEEPLRPAGEYLPNALLDDSSFPEEDGGDSQVDIVRFFGPPLTRWKRELEEVGAVVLEHLRSQDYTVRVRRGTESRLREFRFIAGRRPYSIRDTVLTPLAWTENGSYVSGPETVFDILLHPGGDYELVDHFLGRLGAEVVDRSIRLLSFRWPDSIPSIDLLLRVAAQPDVALLDVRREARPTCDRARRLIGADLTLAVNPTGLTGNDQTIAVADTGFDDLHADLNGRILRLIPRGRQYDPSDPTGHGTHVASVAAGTGAASGAAGIVGAAPGASLVLQSVMDAKNTMSGLYQPDLASLFDEAYAHGARIMNNSWGIPNDSRYRPNAFAVDQWTVDHPDMLLVFSAGNGGTAAFNRISPVGFVDLFSVDDPATAKNVLTVGASRSDRVGDPPEAAEQWRQRNPRAFGDPPIADEMVAGNPQALAADSSRGPCGEDTRIKPDVVAPGTLILAARASTAPDKTFDALHPTLPGYAYLSGTSVAAPFVTGCAALVRQYLMEVVGHHPSAALLKAILVNGTEWLTAPDAVALNATAPNYHQGFGRIDLRGSLPNTAEPAMRLAFCDDWAGTTNVFSSQDDVFEVTFEAGSAMALRICLTWLDQPGRGIQQQLHLWVTDPAFQDHRGNDGRYMPMVQDDGANNVQIVRIETPSAGTYVAQITAPSLMRANIDQAFAFVVTGELLTPLMISKV